MCLPTILAYLLGLGFGFLFPYLPLTTLSLTLCCLILILYGEQVRRWSVRQGCLLFGALLLGLLWSTLADQNHSVNGLKDYFRSAPVMVQGVISEPVQHTPGRLVMIVDVFAVGEPSPMREATGLLRLSWRGAESSVYLGDQIQVRARLRAPFGTKNPGGFDYGVWLARQGIDAVATVKGAEGVQVLSRNPKGWWERGWHQIDVVEIRTLVSQSRFSPPRPIHPPSDG